MSGAGAGGRKRKLAARAGGDDEARDAQLFAPKPQTKKSRDIPNTELCVPGVVVVLVARSARAEVQGY
jgi:hypothetical protein